MFVTTVIVNFIIIAVFVTVAGAIRNITAIINIMTLTFAISSGICIFILVVMHMLSITMIAAATSMSRLLLM